MLLLTIIQKHCPKVPTKEINIPGRTALGVQRHFEALRKSHPLDSSGNVTGFGGPVAKSVNEANSDEEPAVDDRKRKAGVAKKGTAKKVKKEAVKPAAGTYEEDVKAFDEQEISI